MSGSLRTRLGVAAAIAVVAALALSAIGLALLFERHTARRLAADLDVHLSQLAAGLAIGADGAIGVERPPADPRFADPVSGLYWQAESGGVFLASRSLWDARLTLPADTPADGSVHTHRVAGPGGADLVVAERLVRIGTPVRAVRIAVGADLAPVTAARDAFLGDLLPGLALFGALLLAGAYTAIRLGLRPLDLVQARIAAVRSGASARVEGGGPAEVAPLIEELNALLAEREAATERARRRAADLAHGLKTPLAALTRDAERLTERGETAIAGDVARTAADMRRHVERELVRARLAAPSTRAAGTEIGAVVAALVATVARTPDGERLDFTVDGAPLVVPFGRADLMESLGPLVENAARHARSQVAIGWTATADGFSVTVDDDGPGIAAADRARVLDRGTRLDESGPGTGLGLAIVAEIADAYGATLSLETAPLGGLRARLTGRHAGPNPSPAT